MSGEIAVLSLTAASIGFFHTLFGPDHYLPFIVMSKARGWNVFKTALIAFVCGLGHILSSVVLGFIGIGLGLAVSGIESVESLRGGLASWMLMAFGFTYMVWGVRKAIKNSYHSHVHVHGTGEEHEHFHSHYEEHSHPHVAAKKASITPWILFTIFIFGPCEPLIPILMYPAAKNNILGLIVVTSIFAMTTITTMMTIIILSSLGLSFLPMGKMERFSHALAGFTIMLCAFAMIFLEL